jgi:hypothetical protein
MGSPFCKPNEKIQNEDCKKINRHLTKKKEREERGQESKKPGIDPAITEESRAASAARVAFQEPCHAMDSVRGIPMTSNEQSVSASVQTIDPVVERKSEGAASTLES